MGYGGTVRGVQWWYGMGVRSGGTVVRYGVYGGTLVVFFAELVVFFAKLVVFFSKFVVFFGYGAVARYGEYGGTVRGVRWVGAPPQPYHPYRSPYLCTVAKCTLAPPQAYHRTAPNVPRTTSSVPSICTCTLPASRNVSIHGL